MCPNELNESNPGRAEELVSQINELEIHHLETCRHFVTNIPEWSLDPSNHKIIASFLSTLPTRFMAREDFKEILVEAIGSLPFEVAAEAMRPLGAADEDVLAIMNEIGEIDRKYNQDPESFLAVEISKFGPTGYAGDFADGH